MATFEGMTEEDQLNTLMAELKDSNIRQSVMEYIANKSEVAPGTTDKQRLSKMIETIAAESVTNQKQSALWKSRTKKSILLGIVAVIVAITVQFLVNFFSNELSKESHVTGGTMVGTDGSVVKTQLDEMRVNADGQLQGRTSVKTIKTTPSLNRIALASSLPDTTLMALDEITVYSDKGHTLRVKVHGFARVPVLNSHCGNLVHFYTAWNGRITLDSTDLSFDKDTESHFKDAGFSLAVGGFGGRRLAGGSRANAFFKHVDKLKKSGSWTCADVPLPTTVDTLMMRETEYEPCKEHACYSDFGGLQLGVAKIAEAHALVAMPVTKRMRAVLKGNANEVFYRRSETTTIVSPTYSLEIKTVPAHFGQEKINLVDRVNDKTVTFQLVIGNKEDVAYCKAGADDDVKRTKKTIADKEVESDVHMQFNGLVQEEGKTLRHWKWSMGQQFVKAAGGGGAGLISASGEFWDYADTLLPYRQLDNWGGIIITESFSAKSTDADVEAALALRTKNGIKDLMECKAREADENVPKMEEQDGASAELNEAAISYYLWQVFGDTDAALRVAATGEKDDTYTQLAQYLMRGEKAWSDGSVSDPCYLACKEVLDAYQPSDYKTDEEMCTNGVINAVVECLHSSHPECSTMPWMVEHGMDCQSGDSDEDRALEEETDEPEPLVPAKDGTADLVRASPTLQAALAQAGLPAGKVAMNATLVTRQRRRRLFFWHLPFMCMPFCPYSAQGGRDMGHAERHSVSRQCSSCAHPKCWWNIAPSKGKSTSKGWLACMSWAFCIAVHWTGMGLLLYLAFHWGKYEGFFQYSYIAEACITGIHLYLLIPPPVWMSVCIGGQLHVFGKVWCPDNGRYKKGGGCYIRIQGGLDLLFCIPGYMRGWFGDLNAMFIIMVLGLEIGVQWGHQFHRWRYPWHCWRAEWRRRHRRRHTARRRARWRCYWANRTTCDTYTRWYMFIRLTNWVKFGYEQYEWVKAKMQEGWLYCSVWIMKSWKWKGIKWKWQRVSQYLLYRKYNRGSSGHDAHPGRP